ncbi:MAG: DUF1648 domain-containing protein [Anaerolineae bacterium]|nr:DUF1648 domain-containing protein [Anaerolineae bacterium]
MKLNNQWVMPVCIGIMLVTSLILYPSLPDELPIHWNLSGEVDDTAPKAIAVFIMPLVAILVFASTYIVPMIDPRRDSYEKFAPSYERVRLALVMFMVGIHIIMLTQYDNPQALIRLLLFAVSLLLAVIGNEMGRFRPTWFTGIRTPWTLADERVWRKTHRVGARWFVGMGLTNMLVSLILPLQAVGIVIIITTVTVSLGLVAYSYFVYRHINTV